LALIPAANEIAREAHKFRSALSKLARIKYTKARKKSVTTYKKKNPDKPLVGGSLARDLEEEKKKAFRNILVY